MIDAITQNDLDLHSVWLHGESNGVKLVTIAGKIAIEANLSGANLRSADLSEADLSGADLRSADLSVANLRSADLSGADLSEADLSGADLSGADLSGADLSGANLRSADLSGANLSGADLSGANLRSADLSGANLSEADLSGANLSGADLSGAENVEYAAAITTILPAGTLTVYKSARTKRGKVILTLEIPETARRSNSTGRKCRAEFAILRGVDGAGWEYDGSPVFSQHDNNFVYPAIGETIMPDGWNENRWEECAAGIHFFITRLEAEQY